VYKCDIRPSLPANSTLQDKSGNGNHGHVNSSIHRFSHLSAPRPQARFPLVPKLCSRTRVFRKANGVCLGNCVPKQSLGTREIMIELLQTELVGIASDFHPTL